MSRTTRVPIAMLVGAAAVALPSVPAGADPGQGQDRTAERSVEAREVQFSDRTATGHRLSEEQRNAIATDAYEALNLTYEERYGRFSERADARYTSRSNYFEPSDIQVVQIQPTTDDDLGGFVFAPSHAAVASDGTVTPPSDPRNFAAAVGGSWGSEEDSYAATYVDYGSAYTEWARNRTVWTWWKLEENNSTYAYYMVQSDAALENSGGTSRTKAAVIGTKSGNTSAVKLEQDPQSELNGSCSTYNVNVGVSAFGSGANASWDVSRCEKWTPKNTSYDIDQRFYELHYTHPNDGAQGPRELMKAVTFRVPESSADPQLSFSHGVVHNYYCPDCKSCAA